VVETRLVTAAVQARLDLVALEGGVARFGSGPAAYSVAVLDVVGADVAMASADDTTQDELLAGRAQFLNAQTAPFQVLVRAEPVDLDGHLRRVHFSEGFTSSNRHRPGPAAPRGGGVGTR
jgi:hypothetical protein